MVTLSCVLFLLSSFFCECASTSETVLSSVSVLPGPESFAAVVILASRDGEIASLVSPSLDLTVPGCLHLDYRLTGNVQVSRH